MIKIRLLEEQDICKIVAKFRENDWIKPALTFETYLEEQQLGERIAWVAECNSEFAGYVTLKWCSEYKSFQDKNIPEVMDLNVLPKFRNRGVGSVLLETAEKEAEKRNDAVGLGVGLYADYGNAQKLYVKRGYVPDGCGITYKYQCVNPDATVQLDDDLVLWLIKKLR